MAKRQQKVDAQQVQLRIVQLESFLRVWQLVRIANAQRAAAGSLSSFAFRDETAASHAEAYIAFMLYSMLYSLFDRSGIDIRKFQATDPELRDALNALGARWQRIETPVARIRHNVGFHGAKTRAGTEAGMAALLELGQAGAVTAFEIIEDLFHLAPWLSEEAQGAAWIPKGSYPHYHDMLVHRATALEHSRTRYGQVDEVTRRAELAQARQHLDEARVSSAKLVEALSLQNSEQRQGFSKFWEGQIHGVSKRIDDELARLELPAKLEKLQQDVARLVEMQAKSGRVELKPSLE